MYIIAPDIIITSCGNTLLTPSPSHSPPPSSLIMGATCCRPQETTELDPDPHPSTQKATLSDKHDVITSPSSSAARRRLPSRIVPSRPDKTSHDEIQIHDHEQRVEPPLISYDITSHPHPHSNLEMLDRQQRTTTTTDTDTTEISGADLSAEEMKRATTIQQTSRTSILSTTKISHRAAFDYMCIIGSGMMMMMLMNT